MMVAFQLDMTVEWVNQVGKGRGQREVRIEVGACCFEGLASHRYSGCLCHRHCPLTGVCTVVETVGAAPISNALLSLLQLLQQTKVTRDCKDEEEGDDRSVVELVTFEALRCCRTHSWPWLYPSSSRGRGVFRPRIGDSPR